MFFSQGFSRIAAKILRNSLSSCRWFLSRRPGHHPTFIHSNEKEQLDPSSLVADEVSLIAKRLQSMVVTEIPKFATAAGYFFNVGVEGKSLCPTLWMFAKSDSPADGIGETLMPDLRQRQQYVAEIAEMINVGSVIHNEVLDDADTRRGIASLSSVMSNKIAVLTGDLLISQALVALSLLKNAEVISLMSTALENLVTGETMQMTATSEQRCSMEYYMQKAYYKTASLSNGCKAVAYLADQKEEVATMAFEYGKNLGLAYQLIDDILGLIAATPASPGKCSSTDIHRIITTAPILFAMEEFPQLRAVIDSSFNNPAIANVDTVLEYLGKSNGIQRTIELAVKHTKLAALAIDSLPETNDVNARKARRALIHFTQKIITRNK